MAADLGLVTPVRAEARRTQQALAEATLQVAARLGSGHPEVEKAKRHIQKFRNSEEALRWKEVANWHGSNIASAAKAAEEGTASTSLLERAVRMATTSELGPGAACIASGKEHIRDLKKQRQAGLDDVRVKRFQAMLEKLLQEPNLANIQDAINIGARSLGPAHPVVEEARQAFKQKRVMAQRSEWDELVLVQDGLMASACATGRPELIEAQIKAALDSGIGRAHPIVADGQKKLLKVRKEVLRVRQEKESQECSLWLHRLTLDAERSLKRLESEVNQKALPAPA